MSQDLYNQLMDMNAQRNQKEGVWMSESESGGEIQMTENLVGMVGIVSESQVNETQERESENVSEVRVNEHDSHLN